MKLGDPLPKDSPPRVCLSYVNADRRVLSYPSEVTPLAELGPSLIALRRKPASLGAWLLPSSWSREVTRLAIQNRRNALDLMRFDLKTSAIPPLKWDSARLLNVLL
jgi:hypothetical protein